MRDRVQISWVRMESKGFSHHSGEFVFDEDEQQTGPVDGRLRVKLQQGCGSAASDSGQLSPSSSSRPSSEAKLLVLLFQGQKTPAGGRT